MYINWLLTNASCFCRGRHEFVRFRENANEKAGRKKLKAKNL